MQTYPIVRESETEDEKFDREKREALAAEEELLKNLHRQRRDARYTIGRR